MKGCSAGTATALRQSSGEGCAPSHVRPRSRSSAGLGRARGLPSLTASRVASTFGCTLTRPVACLRRRRRRHRGRSAMRLAPLCCKVGTALVATLALAALPAAAEAPPFRLGSHGGGAAQAPACVPAAECGSVPVPLFRSRPTGPTIDVGYALIRHRDPALPTARGTVVFNPGGPGGDVIASAAMWTGVFGDLVSDHDLLLIDPRGTGRSHALSCGWMTLPATRQ